MTLRIVFRRAASSEFKDAAIWYNEKRHGLGEEFIREIDEAIAKAAGAPQRYPIVFGDVRRAVCTSLSIYRVLPCPFGCIGCPRSVSRTPRSDNLAAPDITLRSAATRGALRARHHQR